MIHGTQLDATVDLLRSITNGVTLSVVERPERWPNERQVAVIDHALDLLGLAPEPDAPQ